MDVSRDSASVSASLGWIATVEGAHLRGRVIMNTQPEVRLRRTVHGLGLRFRLRRRIVGYFPDMVLPRYRLAVFVDGCFWHDCPVHGPKQFRGPNAERWRSKIATNASRDRGANDALRAAGWRVLRIWECETRSDVGAAARRVLVAAHAAESVTDEGEAD